VFDYINYIPKIDYISLTALSIWPVNRIPAYRAYSLLCQAINIIAVTTTIIKEGSPAVD
jgi:hypothetical protein